MQVELGNKPSLVGQQPVDVGTTTAPAAAPAAIPTPAAAPAATLPARQSTALAGDYVPTVAEVNIPRIQIAQNMGILKDTYTPGTMVFNGNIVLYVPPKFDKTSGNTIDKGTGPVNLTCLGLKKPRYGEKVEGGVGGMIVNSEDEVRANGGTLDYNEWKLKSKDGMKRFEYVVDGIFAVERPAHLKNDGGVFVYEIDGKKYAVALWTMRGAIYTAATKNVLYTNRQTGCLQKGYPSRGFETTVFEKTFFGGTAKSWVPKMLPLNDGSSPAFMAWAASVLNPSQSADEAGGAES